MAAETFRIEIPINVKDNTDPGVSQATRKVSGFDAAAEKTQRRLNQMNRTRTRILLEALDRASAVIGAVSSRVKGIAGKTWKITMKAVDMATKPLRSILSGLNSALGMMGLGLGVTGGIVIPIKMTIQQQNVETAFEVLLGSADAAKQRVDELTTFAGNTPFTRDEIYEASRMLQVFTGNAMSTGAGLQMVGDIAAGTQQGFSEVALWVGRLYDAMQSGNPVGEMTSRLQEMGAINGEARKRLEDLADSGLDISQTWPQATEEFQRFDGMMEKMSGNMSNLLLGVKSFFTNNVVKKLGNGLTAGLTPALQAFRQWRKDNSTLITQMGEDIEKNVGEFTTKVVDKLTGMVKKVSELWNDPAFQKADLFGKINIAWHKIVADPFANWWNSKGKPWFAEKASKIGEGIGSAITRGVLALLGIDVHGAVEDGLSIGSSFADGFAKGFDGKKIGEAVLNAIKGVFADAGTLLPGGEEASSTSGLSAALIAVVSGKIIKAVTKAVKGGKSLIGGITDLFGKGSKSGSSGSTGSPAMGSVTTSTMQVQASVVYVNGKTIDQSGMGKAGKAASGSALSGVPLSGLAGKSLLGAGKSLAGGGATALPAAGGSASGEVVATVLKNGTTVAGTGGAITEGLATLGTSLGSGASTMGGAAAAGGASIAGGVMGAVGVGAGLYDIYQGTQKTGDEAKEEYWQGGTKIGMVGAGAGAGAAIGSVVPVVGTAVGALVGAGVGGIAALLGGDEAGSALSDWWDNTFVPGWNSLWDNVGGFFTNTVPKWWGGLCDTVGGFFTETIPQKWNEFWGGVGDFFTKTVPQWWGGLCDTVGSFFTETIPQKWNEFWNSIIDFFTKKIPYAVGYAGRKVADFFTVTIPQKWSEFWSAVGDFFAQIPEWWNNLCSTVGNFFTVTIPQKWSEFWGAVGSFFTETIPEWWGNLCNTLGTFFTVTIPQKWSEFWGAIGSFFTETIPEWWGNLCDSLGSFFMVTIPEKWNEFWGAVGGFFTETIPNWAQDIWNNNILPFFTETIPGFFGDIWDGVVDFFTKKIPEVASNIWESIKSFFTEGIPNFFKGIWNNITSSFSQGWNDAGAQPEAHAWGGIMTKPHMGIVAEAGAEGIVPLSPSKRSRGLDIWRRVGEILGVRPYADGDIVGEIPPISVMAAQTAPMSAPDIEIKVTLSPSFTINGNDSPEGTAAAVKSHIRDIADEISDEIARKIAGIWSNMPITGGAV